MISTQADLRRAWATFQRTKSEYDFNRAVWTAVAIMRAELPPVGPDLVEIEITHMFAAWDVPAAASTQEQSNA